MQLTKAEEQVMHILWTLGEGTVQDILKEFEGESKPARTTIATVLNILESKEFVKHHTSGRINIYSPVVTKESYSKGQLFGFIKNYFNGSFSALASFFAKEANLSVEEMDALLEEARQTLTDEEKEKLNKK
ncbi:BlaI/MecI/CopY family transcriptional regulator [Dysgonomonas macrotermitis]|uniref:Predicted transcriptional regulator n=1 Tax=Dysgonomonas macrotermitis TaxID=1346286 RepID=A0A1M5F5E6_9BACT|nr:BlaI/MecI/CopY family transcriptional regulator [Dysgonomonas macrotermitis]SHF86737.1 Predicted transcriptional regulator [Dysgonomonas macrotermitis]